MSYVLAKTENSVGCLALRIDLGSRLIELKREVYSRVGYSAVELITISRPSAYGEYGPYRVVETEEEFKEAVYRLIEPEIEK